MNSIRTQIATLVFLCFNLLQLSAQGSGKPKIYDPLADAGAELELAINNAKKTNKHVLVQVGGNWCSWCIKLNKFIKETPELDSIIKTDYQFLHVNYSKENKNLLVMEKLGYPQRFGFPVIVILNAEGERLHTQDTGYLESEKSYDQKKIRRFLTSWNIAAMRPENYQK